MRVVVAIGLVAAFLAGQESAPATKPGARMLTRTEMLGDLGVLEAAIRRKWAYLGEKEKKVGVDVQALVAGSREQVPQRALDADFAAAIGALNRASTRPGTAGR